MDECWQSRNITRTTNNIYLFIFMKRWGDRKTYFTKSEMEPSSNWSTRLLQYFSGRPTIACKFHNSTISWPKYVIPCHTPKNKYTNQQDRKLKMIFFLDNTCTTRRHATHSKPDQKQTLECWKLGWGEETKPDWIELQREISHLNHTGLGRIHS